MMSLPLAALASPVPPSTKATMTVVAAPRAEGSKNTADSLNGCDHAPDASPQAEPAKQRKTLVFANPPRKPSAGRMGSSRIDGKSQGPGEAALLTPRCAVHKLRAWRSQQGDRNHPYSGLSLDPSRFTTRSTCACATH